MDVREWLDTNGTGAFAMGTVSGLPTRRYHGLLVASLRPPTERRVILARADETVDGIELATVAYPGTIHPRGHEHLADFRIDPVPTWTYRIGDVRLERRVFLVPGRQAVAIRWRADAPVRLRVAPMLAMRDYHALGRARAIDASAVRFTTNGARFVDDPAWYWNAEYAEEKARGLDFQEDLWRPGFYEWDGVTDAWMIAGIEDAGADIDELERARAARSTDRLRAAAEQFLVRRQDGSLTIIAGYPWFTDWGRDTMIALPGLLLATGCLDDARDVLRGFLHHLDRGLIPNLFPDAGAKPEYNTADATLWLFQAVRAYLEAGGDRRFVTEEVVPAAREIVRWHLRGTHHGIRVDPADGLLISGDPGTNLTWMDARVDGRPVTPRHGKAVEINALWYNALRELAAWGRAAGIRAETYDALADRVGFAFMSTFWNPARRCLYDVVLPEGPDGRIRPNQIIALSLPHRLVPDEAARQVLEVVERELLTPVGLRTLAPGEPGYVPHYGGGPGERDGGYHQGTVWPWLLGPYVHAVLQVRGRSAETVAACSAAVAGLERHLDEGCLGTIAEVFDAESPHRAGGAPAQAWSVAALLEVLPRLVAAPKPGNTRADPAYSAERRTPS